jgi:hypothetical protein
VQIKKSNFSTAYIIYIFQAPEPVQPWTGVLDAATSFGHRCPQIGPAGREVNTWQSVVESMAFSRAEEETREDCLYLQVYSPNVQKKFNFTIINFTWSSKSRSTLLPICPWWYFSTVELSSLAPPASTVAANLWSTTLS